MMDHSSARHCLQHLLAMTWDPDLGAPPTPACWGEVVSLALAQGVAHLLHLPAQRLGRQVPEAVSRQLREAYLRAGALNCLRLRELGVVLGILESVRTPILLLKGAALAETLYQNIALRPMGDLDLAVPQDRVPECREALVAKGYRLGEEEERPGSHLLHRGQEAYFPPPPLRTPVGLHWRPLDLPYYLRSVPAAWFWNNTGSAQVQGCAVHLLSDRANLVYLPAHLALHHRLSGLPWLVDLAWLLHRAGRNVDWPWVVSQVGSLRLTLAVRSTLDRLAEWWPSLPIEEPRRLLTEQAPAAGEQRMFRLLTAEPRTAFLDFASDIAGLPDMRSRARFVLANTFPQTSYMRRRYPAGPGWLLPLWYAYRLGDGAVKSLRTLAQIARLP